MFLCYVGRCAIVCRSCLDCNLPSLQNLRRALFRHRRGCATYAELAGLVTISDVRRGAPQHVTGIFDPKHNPHHVAVSLAVRSLGAECCRQWRQCRFFQHPIRGGFTLKEQLGSTKAGNKLVDANRNAIDILKASPEICPTRATNRFCTFTGWLHRIAMLLQPSRVRQRFSGRFEKCVSFIQPLRRFHMNLVHRATREETNGAL